MRSKNVEQAIGRSAHVRVAVLFSQVGEQIRSKLGDLRFVLVCSDKPTRRSSLLADA